MQKNIFSVTKIYFPMRIFETNMAGLSDLQSTFPEERLDGKTVSKLISICVFSRPNRKIFQQGCETCLFCVQRR